VRQDVLVYLSGPITPRNGHTVEENVHAASVVHNDLLNQGIPVFCPHFSAAVPASFTDVPYETWLELDYAIINRCTHVLMLPRWEESQGAQLEKAYAERVGKPVLLSHIELLMELGMV
jgi:Domain of unknown function (DUF4406)